MSKVNINGVWKDLDKVFVNIGGVWKEAEKMFCNIGGVWKEVEGLGLEGLFTIYRHTSDRSSWSIRERNPITLAIVATRTFSGDIFNDKFESRPGKLYSKGGNKIAERNPITLTIITEKIPTEGRSLSHGIAGTNSYLYTSGVDRILVEDEYGSGYEYIVYYSERDINTFNAISTLNLGSANVHGAYRLPSLTGIDDRVFAFRDRYYRQIAEINPKTANSIRTIGLNINDWIADMVSSKDSIYTMKFPNAGGLYLELISPNTLATINSIDSVMSGAYPDLHSLIALK